MGPAVSSAQGESLRLNDLDDLRLARIGLGIHDMDARGANAGDDEITPLRVRMRSEGTQAGAARVPAKVMQFVAGVGHVQAADHLPVCPRSRINIHYAEGVRASEIGRAS